MKHYRPPILVKRPHEEIIRDACGLMADGRPRTAVDVAVTIRCKPGQASAALKDLHKRGRLSREWIADSRGPVAIYAKQAARAAQQASRAAQGGE